MNKGKLIWGIICLVIAGGLAVANLTLPPGDLMFQIGDINMPWVPPIALVVVGIILLASVNQQEEGKKEAEAAVDAIEKDDIPKVGEDGVKLILNCSLILSPIKGKDISTLVPGDRVMLSIVDSDSKAISVAKAFNAYQNNKMTPITGRIKMIKNTPDGYLIYTVIAKGILGKTIEEEANIKVAMDPNFVWTNQDEAETKSYLPMIVVLLVVIAVLVAVVLTLIRIV